jgi:hypothetical protein
MQKILVVIITLAMSSLAQAGSAGNVFSFNAFIFQNGVESSPGGSSDSSINIYDLKFGNISASGLYLGAIYSMYNHEATGSTAEDGKSLGASIGYVGNGGGFIMAHYYLTSEHAKYKKGSGYQLDFGYLTSVSGAFQVGVELVYRNLTYKENEDIPGLESCTIKMLTPMLSLAYSF